MLTTQDALESSHRNSWPRRWNSKKELERLRSFVIGYKNHVIRNLRDPFYSYDLLVYFPTSKSCMYVRLCSNSHSEVGCWNLKLWTLNVGCYNNVTAKWFEFRNTWLPLSSQGATRNNGSHCMSLTLTFTDWTVRQSEIPISVQSVRVLVCIWRIQLFACELRCMLVEYCINRWEHVVSERVWSLWLCILMYVVDDLDPFRRSTSTRTTVTDLA